MNLLDQLDREVAQRRQQLALQEERVAAAYQRLNEAHAALTKELARRDELLRHKDILEQLSVEESLRARASKEDLAP